jgi:hypothetical protein
MKTTLLALPLVLALLSPLTLLQAAKPGSKASKKAPAAAAGEPSSPDQGEPSDRPKRDTYPLYGKVTAVTSRSLTVVRSDNPEAKEVTFNLNEDTAFTRHNEPAKRQDVQVGQWIGGVVKKSTDGGAADLLIKVSLDVKQRAKSAKAAPKEE